MSNQQDQRQQFTIQPHPATTNDPADLARKAEGAFAGQANVFNTPGPAVPSAQVAQGLDAPKSRAELEEETKKLNA